MKDSPEYLRELSKELETSFTKIKTDPMNLNLTMEHIAKLSEAVSKLLENVADRNSED